MDAPLPVLCSHFCIMVLRINADYPGRSLVPVLHLGMMRLLPEWTPSVTSGTDSRFELTTSHSKAWHSTDWAIMVGLLVFRYNTKDYCMQQVKPQLATNQPKIPHTLLPFGEILSSHHVIWCNFAKPYFMHHWTSHLGPGRKAPAQVAK